MTPPILPPSLAVWLIGGAIVAVLARAVFTSGQSPLSRETGQDAVLAVVFAVAWGVPIPGLSLLWPPFAFPESLPGWQAAILFGGLVFVFGDLGKRALLAWAPKAFAKYTGQPENGGKP
jgi:hypothetical protein